MCDILHKRDGRQVETMCVRRNVKHRPCAVTAMHGVYSKCVLLLSAALFDDDVAGVPEFWLTIFKNVDMLSDMVQDHDEPILRHLLDIKVNFQEANPMVSA